MTKRSAQDHAWFPLGLGFAALALLIGVLGVWSVKARIAGAVIASGMIQLENNRQVVQHPQGGVVGEILVKNGDTVVAGQVLLRLDDTIMKSELTIVEGQLFEIHARKARLEAERDGMARMTVPKALAEVVRQHPEVQSMIDGHRRLFDARLESMRRESDQILEQIDQGHNQIAGTSAQLAAFQTQQDLIFKELTDAQALFAKGLTQAARVSSLQREQARLMGEIGNLIATIAQLRGKIAALGIQQIKLTTTRREEANTTLSDLQYREIELAERRLALHETLSRMAIRSPVAGVIHGSQIFALQAVISPAAPIMYVIPQDQPLVVSARIQVINIDQVYVGQAASLRFTAFEQRTTPEISGRVARISADVFSDDATGLSFYQAELLPDEGELDKLGGQKLLPGIPVEAFIRTVERSPLSYLAKPVTDYFVKAFR
jgi:HlyD family secretion protein